MKPDSTLPYKLQKSDKKISFWLAALFLAIFLCSSSLFIYVSLVTHLQFSQFKDIIITCAPSKFGSSCGEPVNIVNLSFLFYMALYSFIISILSFLSGKSSKVIKENYSFIVNTETTHNIEINIFPVRNGTMTVMIDGKNVFNSYTGSSGYLYSGFFKVGLNTYNINIPSDEEHKLVVSVDIPTEIFTLTNAKAIQNQMKYRCNISFNDQKIVDNNKMVYQSSSGQ